MLNRPRENTIKFLYTRFCHSHITYCLTNINLSEV
jgi:hypothetical protein